jgi:carboxypeptidase PM20D1
MPFTSKKVVKLCSSDDKLDALVRTTVAVTQVSGGSALNVLPQKAEAWLDVRLLHGDDDGNMLRYIEDMVSDLGITAEEMECEPPSPVSEYRCEQFALIKSCIQGVFGKVRVVPSLVTSSKSVRQYERFCPNVYRFSPFSLTPLDQNRIHGIDEGVRVDSLGLAVSFYRELLLKSSVSIPHDREETDE